MSRIYLIARVYIRAEFATADAEARILAALVQP